MYQPAPGLISTTVWLGPTPKKASVSRGWRKASRATLAGSRQSPARIASSGSVWALRSAASASASAVAGASVAGVAASVVAASAGASCEAGVQAPSISAARARASGDRVRRIGWLRFVGLAGG